MSKEQHKETEEQKLIKLSKDIDGIKIPSSLSLYRHFLVHQNDMIR